MEQAAADFHERVASAFGEFATPAWQAAHPEAGRVTSVDATGSIEDVFARVRGVVEGMARNFPS
jgi:thymidylate kinase